MSLRSYNSWVEVGEKAATASRIEVWIDETERRTWLLSEIKPSQQ